MLPVLTVNRVFISDSLVFSDRVREESKLLIVLRSRDEIKKKRKHSIQRKTCSKLQNIKCLLQYCNFDNNY